MLFRSVHLQGISERCVFTRGIKRLELPVAHGEGKVVAEGALIERLIADGHAPLRYITAGGEPADGAYPENPNGAMADIAGVCDSTGRVFGLMPHPERFLYATNHPHWTRRRDELARMGGELPEAGDGRVIFENAVAFFE